MVRPQGPTQVEDLDNSTDRITSDEGKAAMLADTFFPSLPPSDIAQHLRITRKWSTEPGTSPSEVPPIQQTELLWTIQRIRRMAAPGLYEIFGTLLKNCIFIIILLPFLLQLFNASLTLGCVLTAWKRARVIAFRKSEKETYSVAKSYHPISLLTILGKTLKSIVNARITRVLEGRGLLSPF